MTRLLKLLAPRLLTLLTPVEIVAGLAVLSLEAGLGTGAPWLGVAQQAFAWVTVAAFALRALLMTTRTEQLVSRPFTIGAVALAALFTLLASVRIAAGIALLHELTAAAEFWRSHERPGSQLIASVGKNPTRMLVLSFATLIGAGSLLLWFPASAGAQPVKYIDALFTATSAVCVTGLTTLDTRLAWSPFGKGVILLLIQLGGLGIMAIAGALTQGFGRAMKLRQSAVVSGAFDEGDAEELRALLKSLIFSTLAIEALGALILFWRLALRFPWEHAARSAVFHSVSAFCNAGFALYSDNLVSLADDPIIILTVGALVVLGGLGFGVFVALWRYAFRQQRHLTLHAKVVLVATTLLIWGGAAAYFFIEYDRSLAHLGFVDKTVNALFQSITPRTAGFNSVPYDALHPLTVMLIIVLMFIGASPGSTGGGVKTTTFAVLLLSMRAVLGEKPSIEVFGRRLSPALVMRAFAITGGYLAAFLLGFGLLLVTEELSFMGLAFETMSALGTVGLSLNVTPLLSVAGKLVVTGLMFAGRVGPLTAVAAARRAVQPTGILLPEDRVVLG